MEESEVEMKDVIDVYAGLGIELPDEVPGTSAAMGARVAALRVQKHLTGAALGDQVGLSRDKISKIESGVRRIDARELPRFANALGATVGDILGRPARSGLAVAARLAPGYGHEAAQAAHRRARQLLEIDDVLTQVVNMPAARTSEGGERVLQQARARCQVDPVSRNEAVAQGRELAELARTELGLGSAGILDLASTIEQNFAVDVALSPLGDAADGLCIHSGSTSLIMASTDFPDGHLRFTLAHELAHHLLDDPREIIEEDSTAMFSSDTIEQRANAFAGHFLMPERGVRNVLSWIGESPPRAVTSRGVVCLMEQFGVSMSALMYHMNLLNLISFDEGRAIKALGVHNLVNRHAAVAASGAATEISRVRRAPQRLTRYALGAAREQRLGVSITASLLERPDDEELWAEIMFGDSVATQ